MTTKRAGWLLTLSTAFIIVSLTLFPEPAGAVLPHWCFRCGSLWLSDWLLNAAVFAPLGAGLALLLGGGLRATLVAALFSVAIELLQRYVIPGRFPSGGDIISNTVGALAGATVAAHWRVLARPPQSLARALALGAGFVWLALIAFMGWTTHRSISHRALWGQWTPDLPHLDRFPGTLEEATIAGEPFPRTRAASSPALRTLLLADHVIVTATVTPGNATQRVASVVSIFDAWRQENLLLGQVKRDAVFRMRSRASDVGLWSPEAILDGAFAKSSSPAPFTLAAIRDRNSILLRVVGGAASGESDTRLGPATGWTLLLPPSQTHRVLRWSLTTVWLGVLLFPAAWWLGFAGVGSLRYAFIAFALIGGLLVIPLFQRVSVPPIASWIAAALIAISSAELAANLKRRLASPQ